MITKMGLVYLLKLTECFTNEKFEAIYIGQTKEERLTMRMQEHQHCFKGYTAKFAKKRLLMVFRCEVPVALERFFKNHRNLVKNLLEFGGNIELWEDSRVKSHNLRILKDFPYDFEEAKDIDIDKINREVFKVG